MSTTEVGYGEGPYGSGAYGGYEMTKSTSVTVTLEEKGKMTVNVEDGTGSAISGATVSISGESSQSTSTDSNGQAVFSGINIGDYDVEVSKDGYFNSSVSVSEGDFS